MEFEGTFFNTSDYEQTNQKLGEGTFGTVYLVKHVKDLIQYAAKIINFPKIFSGSDQLKLMQESSILRDLVHPAITKFYGINFHSFNDPTLLQPTLLTEYVSGGSLKEILTKMQQGFSVNGWNSTRKSIFLLGICSVMKFLHQKEILHGLLKPDNILTDENQYPRVCDFGLSQCFSESLSESIKTSKIENLCYFAPELLKGNGGFEKGSDVYSFGILAYQILTGKQPYANEEKTITSDEFIQKVLSGERPSLEEGITESMKELIKNCLSADIDERPSFDELFNKFSTDFSYFDDDVDKDEINKYLNYLDCGIIKESPASENNKDDESLHQSKKKIERLEKQIDHLVRMIKILIESDDFIQDMNVPIIEGNALHLACEAGNLNLVKYIISLDKFDITTKTVFIYRLQSLN